MPYTSEYIHWLTLSTQVVLAHDCTLHTVEYDRHQHFWRDCRPGYRHLKPQITHAGEFEKHQHCWMGWPDSPYLWRENAKPAQEQYAAVAKAISQFEPLIMLTNPEVRPACLHRL